MQDLRSKNRSLVTRVVIAACMIAVATSGIAQTQAADEGPAATGVVGLNLFGPIVGIYSGSLELALHEDWSMFLVPTYFNAKGSLLGALFEVAGVDENDYELWSISGALGANYFLTDRAPVGLFVGGSVEPGYLYASFDGHRVGRRGRGEIGAGHLQDRWRRARRLPGALGAGRNHATRGPGLSLSVQRSQRTG